MAEVSAGLSNNDLYRIFSYLGAKELSRLEIVCRRFRQVAHRRWKVTRALVYPGDMVNCEKLTRKNYFRPLNTMLKRTQKGLTRLVIGRASPSQSLSVKNKSGSPVSSSVKLSVLVVRTILKECPKLKDLTLFLNITSRKNLPVLDSVPLTSITIDLAGVARVEGRKFVLAAFVMLLRQSLMNLAELTLGNLSLVMAGVESLPAPSQLRALRFYRSSVDDVAKLCEFISRLIAESSATTTDDSGGGLNELRLFDVLESETGELDISKLFFSSDQGNSGVGKISRKPALSLESLHLRGNWPYKNTRLMRFSQLFPVFLDRKGLKELSLDDLALTQVEVDKIFSFIPDLQKLSLCQNSLHLNTCPTYGKNLRKLNLSFSAHLQRRHLQRLAELPLLEELQLTGSNSRHSQTMSGIFLSGFVEHPCIARIYIAYCPIHLALEYCKGLAAAFTGSGQQLMINARGLFERGQIDDTPRVRFEFDANEDVSGRYPYVPESQPHHNVIGSSGTAQTIRDIFGVWFDVDPNEDSEDDSDYNPVDGSDEDDDEFNLWDDALMELGHLDEGDDGLGGDGLEGVDELDDSDDDDDADVEWGPQEGGGYVHPPGYVPFHQFLMEFNPDDYASDEDADFEQYEEPEDAEMENEEDGNEEGSDVNDADDDDSDHDL